MRKESETRDPQAEKVDDQDRKIVFFVVSSALYHAIMILIRFPFLPPPSLDYKQASLHFGTFSSTYFANASAYSGFQRDSAGRLWRISSRLYCMRAASSGQETSSVRMREMGERVVKEERVNTGSENEKDREKRWQRKGGTSEREGDRTEENGRKRRRTVGTNDVKLVQPRNQLLRDLTRRPSRIRTLLEVWLGSTAG